MIPTRKEEYPRDEFRITPTLGGKEASEITITSGDTILVHLKGPMSVYAAGAFIKALEEKENYMHVALEVMNISSP